MQINIGFDQLPIPGSQTINDADKSVYCRMYLEKYFEQLVDRLQYLNDLKEHETDNIRIIEHKKNFIISFKSQLIIMWLNMKKYSDEDLEIYYGILPESIGLKSNNNTALIDFEQYIFWDMQHNLMVGTIESIINVINEKKNEHIKKLHNKANSLEDEFDAEDMPF